MLVTDSAGNLAEIWPLPANRMRPIPHKREYISGFGYTSRHGEPEEFMLPEQICWFRFPNVFDYHRGLSPLTAYSMALKTDKGAQKWNQDIFTDGIPFRTILSAPEHMTDPNMARFRQEIQDEFEARKRMLVVRAGDIDAEELGISNKDMEFLAGREFTREEIDRVFGVPAGFWAKEATRANTEAARASLIEYAVWPLLVLMGEELEAQVLQRYYDESLTVQPEDIRPRDRALLVEERTQYWQVQTVNEARQELGLEELEDEELGAKLVPLAIKGAPAAPFGGGGFPPQEEPPDGEELEKEAKADLRRWKSIALRRLKAGESPGEYVFESDYISEDVVRQVKALLDGAKTEDEIKAAFDDTRAYADAMIAQIQEWYGGTDGDDEWQAIKKKNRPVAPK